MTNGPSSESKDTKDSLEPRWKKFEKLAFEIQKELAPTAEVRLNDHIDGIDSKTPRQIDISIRQSVGQYPLLIIVDCKDHEKPLDVNDVEQFGGLLRDVRAHRGALVSSSGFTMLRWNTQKRMG